MDSRSAGDDSIIDQICNRYEAMARTGKILDLAELLASGPQQLRDKLLEELICLDYEYRQHDGQTITEERYRERFPDKHLVIRRAYCRIQDRTMRLGAQLDQVDNAAELGGDNDKSDMAQSPSDRSRAGEYRLERFLGRGAFSDVYLARDAEQEPVAVKILHDRVPGDSDIRDAFRREAETLKQIQHPATVQLLDEFIDETGRPCLVMEYMSGGSLADYKGPTWPHRRVASFIADLAEALHQIHQQGYSHRDVKPANILLDKDKKPKLADFGLALSDQTYGKGPRGTVAGSLAYLSPEQARGDSHLVDGRADIYSLGIVMYELLTARRPFEADDTQELLRRIQEIEIRPPRQVKSDIPEELEEICLKATEKDPGRRYPTGLDFARALRRYARKPRRRVGFAAVVSVVVLLVAAVAWSPWLQTRANKPQATVSGASTYDFSNLNIQVSHLGKHEFQPLEDFDELVRDDHVRFSVRLNKPAYVRLIWIDAEGEVIELYPNDPKMGFRGDAPVVAFESPVALDEGWPLEPSGDAELALMFVSNQPFDNFEPPQLIPADYPVKSAGVTHHLIDQVGEIASLGLAKTAEGGGVRTRSLSYVPRKVNSPLHKLLEELREKADVVHAVRIPTSLVPPEAG